MTDVIHCGMTPEPSSETVDPVTSRAFRAFVKVLRLHRQTMLRVLDEQGIHHGEAFCLRLVSQSEGISQRDLAESLHLSRPQVTKTLQALERNGFITRRADQNDQRLTLVFLTEQGRNEEGKFHGCIDAYVNQAIGAMPQTDKLELERLLENMAERIAEPLRTTTTECER